jgi:tetratricopeptide (TPR) repeat protein
MKKQQWITAGASFLLVILLFAFSQNQFFGPTPPKKISTVESESLTSAISTETVLNNAKKELNPEQLNRLNFLENSISRGDVKSQQLVIYNQLARFWKDSAGKFEPYAWYIAQAARLENSEKSLTFAAHLISDRLTTEQSDTKQWEAEQAKDLFERSLKLNPSNDSSKIGLGTVLLYGGISSPMQGIAMIKEVAERDPANIYAQMTLGQASMTSGQLDKADERFKAVIKLAPNNLEALLLDAEALEQLNKKPEAIELYKQSLVFIKDAELKKEVEARIVELKTNH